MITVAPQYGGTQSPVPLAALDRSDHYFFSYKNKFAVPDFLAISYRMELGGLRAPAPIKRIFAVTDSQCLAAVLSLILS